VAKADPDEIVAEATTNLPISASAGCVVALLGGLGAINVSVGIASASAVTIVTGLIAMAMAGFLVRKERVGVVRRITVHAGGAVELEVNRTQRDLFVGDVMVLHVARGRGRTQIGLRDGTTYRLASPMEGLTEVADAIMRRHKGFVAKGLDAASAAPAARRRR
jgi:hypothetical protein